MILSVSAQASVFLWFGMTGAAAGLLFDVFRALRRVFLHPNALTQVEDALYWLLVFALVIWLLFTRNNGIMRGYVLLGFALGMTLYFNTVSRPVLRLFIWLIGMTKQVIVSFLMLVTWPLRFLRRVLYIPYVKCRVFAKKHVLSAKKLLHKARVYVKIKIRNLVRDLHIIRKKT